MSFYKWRYIKVIYKGGYIHYYLTDDINYYMKDPEVEKIEYVEQQTIRIEDFGKNTD